MQDAFVARDRRRDQEVKLKPARTTIATQQSQLTDTLTVGRHRVRPFSGDGACTKRMTSELALLAISPRQMRDVHAPFQRRLAPFLLSRWEFPSLVNASNAQAVSDDIGIGRIRVEGGPAHRAEGLGSLGATFRSLDIHGGRSR